MSRSIYSIDENGQLLFRRTLKPFGRKTPTPPPALFIRGASFKVFKICAIVLLSFEIKDSVTVKMSNCFEITRSQTEADLVFTD